MQCTKKVLQAQIFLLQKTLQKETKINIKKKVFISITKKVYSHFSEFYSSDKNNNKVSIKMHYSTYIYYIQLQSFKTTELILFFWRSI